MEHASSIEILNQIQEIAQTSFKDSTIIITEETELQEIRNWNSLTHIMFIYSIEQKFDFQFSFEDMLSISTIRAICDIIVQKTQ